MYLSPLIYFIIFFLMKYIPPAKANNAITAVQIINVLLSVNPVGGVIINAVISSSGSLGVLVLGL